MLYDETAVRANLRNRAGKRVFFLGKGDRLTPTARDFLSRERIEILPAEQAKPERYRLLSGGFIEDKPEHMTHLNSDILVPKTHPRIAFRGAMDTLEAEILLCQLNVPRDTAKKLEEMLAFARLLLRCDVLDEEAGQKTLCGMTEQELRSRSHRPQDYYGQPHFMPCAADGPAILSLNRCRCAVRNAELAAARAFTDAEGTCVRTDILRGLNRMSSLIWILMIQLKAADTARGRAVSAAGEPGKQIDTSGGKSMERCEKITEQVMRRLFVPVEASGRHVHVTEAQARTLFGHRLTFQRELSQPGQFLAAERVTVRGPKGEFRNVAVLGPERKEAQVEISLTDGRVLGLCPPVRLSGSVEHTPGVTLIGQQGQLTLPKGVIAAQRHIHLRPEDADRFGVKDKQVVRLQTYTERPVVFADVVVRVDRNFAPSAHLDYDEANACGFRSGDFGRILP